MNKTFEVEVCRTGYGHASFKIQAASADEAREKALDQAGGHLFSEKESEYTVTSISPDVQTPRTYKEIDQRFARRFQAYNEARQALKDAMVQSIRDLVPNVKGGIEDGFEKVDVGEQRGAARLVVGLELEGIEPERRDHFVAQRIDAQLSASGEGAMERAVFSFGGLNHQEGFLGVNDFVQQIHDGRCFSATSDANHDGVLEPAELSSPQN